MQIVQRRRLLIGGVAATFVLAAVAAGFSWRQYDDGKRHALNELDARVVLAATVFDTYFSGQIAALRSIAAAPPVVAKDAPAMARYFRRVRRADKALFTGGLGWIDRSGDVEASTTATRLSPAVNVSNRGYFRTVMATGKPSISAGLVSKSGHLRVVVMAVPTHDAKGRLSGVLAGSLQVMQSRPSRQSIDLGYQGLVVVDRDGQELTATGFAHPANTALLERMRSRGTEVLADTRGLSGSRGRVVAYATSPLPGWISVIDRPPSSVFASARRALLLELVSIIGAALLVLALLAWISRRANRNALAERQRAEIAAELTRSLADAYTPVDVGRALAAALAASFPESAAAVALSDGDGTGLGLAAVEGWKPPLPDRDHATLLGPAAAAFEPGRPLRLKTPAAVTKAFTDLQREWGQEIGSLYAAPIGSRGSHKLGAIVLMFDEPRAFDPRDEAIVKAHLEQAIQALTRTVRQEREHEVAVELQRSLLPDELPQADAVRFAARYHAGGSGVEVGGDWYDAVRRPDGVFHITVGDVAGRGIRAATLMAQLRNAFRAYAFDCTSPGEITRRLLRHIPIDGMATTVCLTYDPYTRHLGYSLAGHPPVLLLDRNTGQVSKLADAAAPPLGFANPESINEDWLTLPESATIVAYTDGLVERRRANIDDGIERIAVELAHTTGRSAEAQADALLAAASERGIVDDDTALVVIDVGPTPATLEIEIPGDPGAMSALRRRIDTWMALRGIGEMERIDAVLALHEACINAIEHGYQSTSGTIKLTIEHRDGSLAMEIEDRGSWRPPTLDPTRGRGTQMMAKTMHSTQVSHNGNGTRVLLEQRLSTDAPRLAGGQ